jgi:hypothetical protein
MTRCLSVRTTDAVPDEAAQHFDPARDRYNRESYEAVTTVSTADLAAQPHTIVDRLFGRPFGDSAPAFRPPNAPRLRRNTAVLRTAVQS